MEHGWHGVLFLVPMLNEPSTESFFPGLDSLRQPVRWRVANLQTGTITAHHRKGQTEQTLLHVRTPFVFPGMQSWRAWSGFKEVFVFANPIMKTDRQACRSIPPNLQGFASGPCTFRAPSALPRPRFHRHAPLERCSRRGNANHGGANTSLLRRRKRKQEATFTFPTSRTGSFSDKGETNSDKHTSPPSFERLYPFVEFWKTENEQSRSSMMEETHDSGDRLTIRRALPSPIPAPFPCGTTNPSMRISRRLQSGAPTVGCRTSRPLFSPFLSDECLTSDGPAVQRSKRGHPPQDPINRSFYRVG
jgi:hypothetical protein